MRATHPRKSSQIDVTIQVSVKTQKYFQRSKVCFTKKFLQTFYRRYTYWPCVRFYKTSQFVFFDKNPESMALTLTSVCCILYTPEMFTRCCITKGHESRSTKFNSWNCFVLRIFFSCETQGLVKYSYTTRSAPKPAISSTLWIRLCFLTTAPICVVPTPDTCLSSLSFCLEPRHVAVVFERGDQHVEEPEAEHDEGGGKLELFHTAKFATDHFVSSRHDQTDSDERAATEDRHGESQTARFNLKYRTKQRRRFSPQREMKGRRVLCNCKHAEFWTAGWATV